MIEKDGWVAQVRAGKRWHAGHIVSSPVLGGFQYDDGGRADAGYRGLAHDCGARAVAILLGIPYKVAYKRLSAMSSLTARHGTCLEYMLAAFPELERGDVDADHIIVNDIHAFAVVGGVVRDTGRPAARPVEAVLVRKS
jgi:hypothetical protein